jgi:LysR substrate binding domain
MRVLRIGCETDVPLQRLLSFLGALYARRPDLDSEVTHMRAAEQLRRLRSGELDLGLIHRVRGASRIALEPVFPGEPLAALLPTGHRLSARRAVGLGDLRDEVLLLPPRAAHPVLHDRLMELIQDSGCRIREVRVTGGEDPRDLLLAVAEGRGVTLRQASALQGVGEFATVVTRHALEPSCSMPDTAVAWLADAPPGGAALLADLRGIARDLHNATERPDERG